MTATNVVILVLSIFLSYSVFVIESHPQSTHLRSVINLDGINPRNNFDLLQLRKETLNKRLPSMRIKRSTQHIITDCIFMTSEEGDYYLKASTVDGTVCGIYIVAEPDQKIELHFNFFDVPCENGGLVSFVDGWELNGEFFPSPRDHPRPLSGRYSEFCGTRKIKQIFSSSQNVALIQYRMPARGTRFGFSLRFTRNPRPCNVLLQDMEEVYTLRNYENRSNCTLSTLFPSAVSIEDLNVGVARAVTQGMEMETGTIHKCRKRGLDDFVEIGGSVGLDSSKIILADSLCGLNSKPGRKEELIACGTTTIRLVSSGAFDNSVTVRLRHLTEEDTNGFMSVLCLEEELKM